MFRAREGRQDTVHGQEFGVATTPIGKCDKRAVSGGWPGRDSTLQRHDNVRSGIPAMNLARGIGQ